MKRKLRFLNMETKQINRRNARQRKQQERQRTNKTPFAMLSCRGVTEHGEDNTPRSHRTRRHRPCCGLRSDVCTCTPPPGLHQRPLRALARRYLTTPLKMTSDTTDVSKFQLYMRDRCKFLPIWVVLLYSYVHVIFNQGELLKTMIDKKALLFKQPWVDWTTLRKVIREARRHNQKTRVFQLSQQYLDAHPAANRAQTVSEPRR